MGSLAFPNLDQAIAAFEKSNPSLNNPGALIVSPFSQKYGATGVPGSIAQFPSLDQGVTAEDTLVQYYANKGYSISDLVNAWSPSNAPGNSPESTNNYISSVANALGVSPNTPLNQAEAGLSMDPVTGTVVPKTSSEAFNFLGIHLSPTRLIAGVLGLLAIIGGIAALVLAGPDAGPKEVIRSTKTAAKAGAALVAV